MSHKTTLLCLLSVLIASPALGATINEVRISAATNDGLNNFVELAGTAGESLHDLTMLTVSGEVEPGTIDFAVDLSTNTIPEDGFFLASTDTVFYGSATDLGTGIDYPNSPSIFALVSGFTGNAGDDLDSDNDGNLEAVPWNEIIDAVALVDGDDTPDVTYGAPTVGPDGDFPPAHIYRFPNGDGDFVAGLFSDFSIDTPGAANVIPEPNSILLGLIALLGLAPYGRRCRQVNAAGAKAIC